MYNVHVYSLALITILLFGDDGKRLSTQFTREIANNVLALNSLGKSALWTLKFRNAKI